MKTLTQIVGLLLLAGTPWATYAVTPLPGEFAACRQWADQLAGTAESPRAAGLKVLYADVQEPLVRGRSWRGTAFHLGDKTYTHGLAFNSTKHILVRMGHAVERFTANVGLGNNDDTQRGTAQGHGSVTFHVLAGGKEIFASPVRRLKDGPMPLDLPLQGAEEFEIRVKDGGDGRGWDQALWAEAMVWLKDGSNVRLQDLPDDASAEFNHHGFSFRYGGLPSSQFLTNWTRQAATTKLDAQRARREVAYRDPATGLEIRLEATLFSDFPAVEWVVHFKNTAATNTPLFEFRSSMGSSLCLNWCQPPQTVAFRSSASRRSRPPFLAEQGPGQSAIDAGTPRPL